MHDRGTSDRRRPRRAQALPACIASACAALLSLATPLARAAELADLVVVAVSPADGRAVIREGASAPAVKRVGDALLGGRYEITALLADGVALDELEGSGPPGSALRGLTAFQVHVYVAGADGRSRVQRFERLPRDERPVATTTITPFGTTGPPPPSELAAPPPSNPVTERPASEKPVTKP